MSLIKIENLTFSYPGSFDNVFENANVQLDSDWKLGFVGRNGRGKTTLLRLLLGEYEYSGKITSSVKIDYFPYEVKDPSMLTLDVLCKVCPTAEECNAAERCRHDEQSDYRKGIGKAKEQYRQVECLKILITHIK